MRRPPRRRAAVTRPMARAICGRARVTAEATVASSVLIRRAMSREDLQSRSSAAWLGCSVWRRWRVDGFRFNWSLSGFEPLAYFNCFAWADWGAVPKARKRRQGPLQKLTSKARSRTTSKAAGKGARSTQARLAALGWTLRFRSGQASRGGCPHICTHGAFMRFPGLRLLRRGMWGGLVLSLDWNRRARCGWLAELWKVGGRGRSREKFRCSRGGRRKWG